MKRLIRKEQTKTFLSLTGGWTDNVHEAREVSSPQEAAKLAQELKLEQVEVYYLLQAEGPTKWDFTVPLR